MRVLKGFGPCEQSDRDHLKGNDRRLGKPSGISSQAREIWGRLAKRGRRRPLPSRGVRQYRKNGRPPPQKSAVKLQKASFSRFRFKNFGSLARSTHPQYTLILKKGPRKGHVWSFGKLTSIFAYLPMHKLCLIKGFPMPAFECLSDLKTT